MNEKIDQTIEILRTEISQLDGEAYIDSKQRLQQLLADLESQQQGDITHGGYDELVNRLKDAITHFEVSHPTLTGVLNELMMTLSNMGI